MVPGFDGKVWEAGGGEERPEAAVGPGKPKQALIGVSDVGV